MSKNKLVTDRNYGIDLLRIISMVYIVILHSLGQGGIIDNAIVNSVQFKGAWFFEIWAMCAVNIFAIISGYVGFKEKEKRYNYGTYIVMWLQVVFYGVLVTLLFKFLKPNLYVEGDLLNMFFPVCKNLYWYFTAYTVLFFLIPLINIGIRGCSKSYLRKLLVIIFVLFCIINNIFNVVHVIYGYSFLWLLLLYMVGAIIKRCKIGEKLRFRYCIIGIIILISISWLWKIYGFDIYTQFLSLQKDVVWQYTSPTMFLVAILYVIGFSKIKLSNLGVKIVGFLAPGAFATYILNNQKYIWDYVMKNRFISLCTAPVYKMLIIIIGFSIIFAVVSMLIDRIRILIFDLLHIKDMSNWIIKLIDKILKKVKYIK